jgi:hypothetical protein
MVRLLRKAVGQAVNEIAVVEDRSNLQSQGDRPEGNGSLTTARPGMRGEPQGHSVNGNLHEESLPVGTVHECFGRMFLYGTSLL